MELNSNYIPLVYVLKELHAILSAAASPANVFPQGPFSLSPPYSELLLGNCKTTSATDRKRHERRILEQTLEELITVRRISRPNDKTNTFYSTSKAIFMYRVIPLKSIFSNSVIFI